ncbi:hypothetical protein ABPG77_004764 [Micractinium sp. CCAP 211/92]
MPQGGGLGAPDLALGLPEHGMHLLFEGTQQRLRLIEVYDITRLQVRYGGHTFGGAAQPPAFGRVSEAFGPTYPGEPEGGLFPLQYPGVLFLFPLGAAGPGSSGHPGGLAQAAADVRHGGSGDRPAAGLPVPLSTPAARILVHHGAAASVAAARAAPPPPLAPGSPYWQQVEAVPGQGLLVGAAGQLLRFGDSPQDVVAELGPPSSTHRKPGGPGAPAVTSGAGVPPAVAAAAPDYYLSYCHLGLDVLFCGATHRLKKLVLHANQPGHPDFGLYSRCNFRVYAPGSGIIPSTGGNSDFQGGAAHEEADGSPMAAYTSAGSEGGASMRTAASEASLATAATGGGSPRAVLHRQQQQRRHSEQHREQQQRRQPPDSEQQQQCQQPASGLSAAYTSLVRFIDDALQIDGEEAPSSGDSSTEAAGGAARLAGGEGQPAGGISAQREDFGCGGMPPAASGRPPRPPASSVAIPAPPAPPVSCPKAPSCGSKKKKKKERQRAAAAARLAAAAGGGGGAEDSEAGTDTDVSFADSAPSSLASSPGMTSFLSSIAASGGLPGTHHTMRRAGAGGAAGLGPAAGPAAGRGAAEPASGYTSEGSVADFACKERRLEGGSAFDGWSEADDLALLVGEEPAPAAAAGQDTDVPPPLALGAPATGQQQQQQQQQQRRPLRVSMGVQTAPAADEPAGAAGVAAAGCSSPDSPDSFVLTDSPALFDEAAAAAEYESVPRQRSSGTQTQPHMLAGPPLRTGSAAGAPHGARGRAEHVQRAVDRAGDAAAAAVGVCSSLAHLQAAFGGAAKPALHTRLGGRHPFGPSHLYAYRGAVFEVLHNGFIATVTLFEA